MAVRGCLWMVEGRCVPLAWFSMAVREGLKSERYLRMKSFWEQERDSLILA